VNAVPVVPKSPSMQMNVLPVEFASLEEELRLSALTGFVITLRLG
jgi:hypothetical protein